MGMEYSDKILIKKIEMTCKSMPSQWNLYGVDDEDFYVRFRYGGLCVRRCKGEEISTEELLYYGIDYKNHDLDGTMTTQRMMEITKDLFDYTGCEISEL